MRRAIVGILFMVSIAKAPLSAQVPDARARATVSNSQARFEVPRDLLGTIRDSLLCALSWDRTYHSWRPGNTGVLITVREDSVGLGATAVAFRVESAGSIDVMAPVPESGLHASLNRSLLVVRLEASPTLAELTRLRPDSVRFDLLKADASGARAWIHPVYVE
jgi:hypothetical protein